MRARLQLWPRERSAQVALILLMVFCGLKGVLIASTVPPWWAPDEDYHWGYISYLDEKHAIPDPGKPFYSFEWNKAIGAMKYNQFGQAPAGPTALTGDPHAVTRELGQLGANARQPTGEPTRPVVHAPLFHATAAIAIKPFASTSIFTRLWLARLINSLCAMLIVFAAWLLAAQIFARAGPRLFVAGIVAVQPMIGFATGTLTNDAALIAFFTLALAGMTFMVKHPPSPQQGIALGSFASIAFLSKSSSLLIIPIAIAVYVYQWLAVRRGSEPKSQLSLSIAWAVGIPAVIAGWFYLFLLIKYHSLTGSVAAINPTNVDAAGDAVRLSVLHAPALTAEWLRDTYATYWSHFLFFERPLTSATFYVPMMLGLTGMLGFGVWLWEQIRGGEKRDPRFAQIMLLLCVALFVIAPWISADLLRRLAGNGFAFNGGRFMLPGYPAAVVLFTLGIGALLKVRVRVIVFPAISLIAAWQGLGTWKVATLDRYYGGAGVTGVRDELYRASFFRPGIVTENSLTALIVLMLLCGGGAWVAGVIAARRSVAGALEES